MLRALCGGRLPRWRRPLCELASTFDARVREAPSRYRRQVRPLEEVQRPRQEYEVPATELLEECAKGDVRLVKCVLGVNSTTQVLLARDEHGRTPLFLACSKGHLRVVKHLLLVNSTSEHVRSKRDATPSTAMASTCSDTEVNLNHSKILKLLLQTLRENNDEHWYEDIGEALALAICNRRVLLVKMLLEAVEPTPQHIRFKGKAAADALLRLCRDDDRSFTKTILDTNPPKDVVFKRGVRPALSFACQHKNVEAVQQILAIDSSPEHLMAPHDADETPLCVVRNHAPEIAALLADVTPDFRSAALDPGDAARLLFAACRQADHQLARTLLERDELATKEVVFPAAKRRTSLSYAAEYGDLYAVQRMLAVDSTTEHLMASYDFLGTPLVFACVGGHADVVRTLLQADASIEHLLERGVLHEDRVNQPEGYKFFCTPLMMACRFGHANVVRELLAADSSYEHMLSHGPESNTALEWAEQAGHNDIVQLLKLAL